MAKKKKTKHTRGFKDARKKANAAEDAIDEASDALNAIINSGRTLSSEEKYILKSLRGGISDALSCLEDYFDEVLGEDEDEDSESSDTASEDEKPAPTYPPRSLVDITPPPFPISMLIAEMVSPFIRHMMQERDEFPEEIEIGKEGER